MTVVLEGKGKGWEWLGCWLGVGGVEDLVVVGKSTESFIGSTTHNENMV